MWQRFTERARRVILHGQEEAQKMQMDQVHTEHLLLGLLREDEGGAAQVLQKMGITAERVRAHIEAERVTFHEGNSDNPKLTARSKRVLELAADEARRLKHNYIGTEHLLIALLREKEGIAAKALYKLGLRVEDTRQQVLEYLNAENPSLEKRPDYSSKVQELRTRKQETLEWMLPMLVRLLPRELRVMGQELKRINKEKEAAILNDDFETAAALRDEALKIEQQMEEFAEHWEQAMSQDNATKSNSDSVPVIVENLITQVEIAIDAVTANDSQKLDEVKQSLRALKQNLNNE